MNMYQLEKQKLLYEVIHDLFKQDIENNDCDFFNFEIIERHNNFISIEADYIIKYNDIEYTVSFDDADEQIRIYKQIDSMYYTNVATYDISYKNNFAKIEKIC